MRHSMLVCLTCGFVATVAQGQLIVGVDNLDEPMYYINVDTGVATPLFESNDAAGGQWGLAYDSATNTLYWNNGSTLFSAPFELPILATNLGTIKVGLSDSTMVGLAFGQGKLYATRNINTEAIFSINLTSLQATVVFSYTDDDFDFGGIDVDSTNGNLYGVNDDTTPQAGLYFINPAGSSTFFTQPYPAMLTDVDGVAIHDRIVYFVTDDSTQDFPVLDTSVTPAVVVDMLPSPWGGSYTFSAATYVPDADRDMVPDSVDPCPNDNPDDSDGDGVCDSADICPGGDDNVDGDNDGVPDFCDPCPVDNPDDSDGDGVCDSADICPGGDDNVDSDGDGVPDGCDLCEGSDDAADADGDGTPDGCDVAPNASNGCCGVAGAEVPLLLPLSLLAAHGMRRRLRSRRA